MPFIITGIFISNENTSRDTICRMDIFQDQIWQGSWLLWMMSLGLHDYLETVPLEGQVMMADRFARKWVTHLTAGDCHHQNWSSHLTNRADLDTTQSKCLPLSLSLTSSIASTNNIFPIGRVRKRNVKDTRLDDSCFVDFYRDIERRSVLTAVRKQEVNNNNRKHVVNINTCSRMMTTMIPSADFCLRYIDEVITGYSKSRSNQERYCWRISRGWQG